MTTRTPARTPARTPTRAAATRGAAPVGSERPRLVRHRRWRRALVATGVVAVLAALVWVLGWSSLLGVRDVEVVGVDRIPEQLVVLTADVEPGTPLARVDTRDIEQLLRTLPPVASVSVHRSWPSTLRITVVERTPVAVVADGSGWRLLDADGVDFAGSRDRPAGLPALAVDLATADPVAVQAAVRVAAGLPASLAREVRSIAVRTPEDVRLRLVDGSVVVWGSAELTDRKAAVVLALLPSEARRYDVRVPDAPTTRGGL